MVAAERPEVSLPSPGFCRCHSPGPSLSLSSLPPSPPFDMLASPPDVSATEVSAPAAVDTSLGNPPLVGMSGPPERSQSASPEVAPANPPWMRGGEAVKVPIEDSSATGCSSAPTARRATAKDTERLLPGLRPALPGVASLPIPPVHVHDDSFHNDSEIGSSADPRHLQAREPADTSAACLLTPELMEQRCLPRSVSMTWGRCS